MACLERTLRMGTLFWVGALPGYRQLSESGFNYSVPDFAWACSAENVQDRCRQTSKYGQVLPGISFDIAVAIQLGVGRISRVPYPAAGWVVKIFVGFITSGITTYEPGRLPPSRFKRAAASETNCRY